MSIRIDCINFSLNLQMMILQVFVGNIIFIFIIGHWGILGPQNPWMSSVPLDKRLRVYYISQPMWAPCLWEVPVFIWLLILQSIFRNIPQLIYNTFLSSFFFFQHPSACGTHSSVLAWRIPRDGGAWWAAVSGVAQSPTWLKRLSSSSSSKTVIGHTWLYSVP